MPLAYRRYYTHGTTPRRRGPRRLYEAARRAYYARRFGYATRDLLGAGRVASIAFQISPTRRETLDLSVMMLEPLPGGRCLEVGCGDGARLEILRDLGWVAVGIDVDPAAVRTASARGLDVRVGPLEDHRFDDASFDAVVSSHVLEHVTRPQALLSECRRLLVPGGRIVIVTPNAESLGHARFGSTWRGLEPPRHLQIFTPRALARAARDAGFERIEVRTIARMAATIDRESRNPLTRRAGWLERARGLAFEIEERRALRRDRNLGEEILLQARR